MKTTLAILTAGVLMSGIAFAKHNKQYDYAKVIEAEPITKHIRISTPRQECWDEEVVRYDHSGYRSATPTLLGSVIGGAIGNELGHHKDAKRAGVVVGALLGGSIGRDLGHRAGGQGGKYYTTEQVCKTYQDYHDEERIVGYHVLYKYRGEVYSTETENHPGDRIKVRVSVIPVEEFSHPQRYRY
ncbi:MAG: glycine zipper 2TM domain-containing protein [Pseudomonadales bacterium]|nr:glycine zipper 2TM domain-containing protein [Pseudomonadales bacterium]